MLKNYIVNEFFEFYSFLNDCFDKIFEKHAVDSFFTEEKVNDFLKYYLNMENINSEFSIEYSDLFECIQLNSECNIGSPCISFEYIYKILETQVDDDTARFLSTELSNTKSYIFNLLNLQRLEQEYETSFFDYSNGQGFENEYDRTYADKLSNVIDVLSTFKDCLYFWIRTHFDFNSKFDLIYTIVDTEEVPNEILDLFIVFIKNEILEKSDKLLKEIKEDVEYYYESGCEDIADVVFNAVLEHLGSDYKDSELDDKLENLALSLKKIDYAKKHQRKLDL